jgi:hypothetical protein
MWSNDPKEFALHLRSLLHSGTATEKSDCLSFELLSDPIFARQVAHNFGSLVHSLDLECFQDHNVELFAWLFANGMAANFRQENTDHILGTMIYYYNPHGIGSIRLFREFLAHGANPNDVAMGGGVETNLHYAVHRFRNDLVQLMMQYGADAQLKNEAGKTAFDVARESRNAEAIAILRGAGA